MNNSQQLANLIQDRAKKVGKSQLQIAKECDISKNFMQSMKKEGYMPRLENLCKLADCLDCSVDYLLGRTDNPQSEPNTHIEQTHSFVQNDSSPILVVNPSNNQLDDIHQELLTYFDKLSFKDKAEIMKMVVDKAEC